MGPLSLLGAISACDTSTVYLMRHCARSTFVPDLYHWDWPFLYLANYSDGGALPDWGVQPTLCTARGRDIIVGEGASLQGVIAQQQCGLPLKVVYDTGSLRDNTTALDFIEGLGADPSTSIGDASMFTVPASDSCPSLPAAERAAGVRARLASVPPLPNLSARLATLQSVLGHGVAPPLQSIPDVVSEEGYWNGGTFAAASWVEAMLLQYGAGLPMAYGRVNASDLYHLLEINVYYRSINDRPLSVEQRGGSNLAAHMLTDLAGTGASMYVGHDTNLDEVAVLLDLAWESVAPYPPNSTTPGSLLRLRRAADNTVTADFLYTAFDTDAGALTVAPVTFAGSAASVKLADLQEQAATRILPGCVLQSASGRAVEEIPRRGVLERPL